MNGDEGQDNLSHSKTFERLVQLSELEEEVSHLWFSFIIEILKISLDTSNQLVVARVLKKNTNACRSCCCISAWQRN